MMLWRWSSWSQEEDCGAHLSGPNLDVEVVPLVGDLEDFGPGEAVDPQPVSVDEQAACTHAQHYLHTLRVLQETHTPRNDTAAAQEAARSGEIWKVNASVTASG